MLALALGTLGSLDRPAFGQQTCEPEDNSLSAAIYGVYAPSGDKGEFRGTAFAIDPRGILMTARHITLGLPTGSYVQRGEDGPKLSIDQVLRSGSFRIGLNHGDDWSIFSVDMTRPDGQTRPPLRTLRVRYDEFLYDYPSELATLSPPATKRPIDAAFDQFGRPNRLPCGPSDAVRISIAGYSKGESGSPLSNGACLYGITSQYSERDVATALREMLAIDRLSSRVIAAFESLEEKVGTEEISFDQLIEEVAAEVASNNGDKSIVRNCLEERTPQVCARDFVDQIRALNESLQNVNITPVSCFAESLMNDVVTPPAQAPFLFDGVTASPLVRFNLNPSDMSDLNEYALSLESPDNDWSLISFYELLASISFFEDRYPDSVDASRRLRNSVSAVASRLKLHKLVQEYSYARGLLVGAARASRVAQVEELKARSASIEAQQEQVEVERRQVLEERDQILLERQAVSGEKQLLNQVLSMPPGIEFSNRAPLVARRQQLIQREQALIQREEELAQLVQSAVLDQRALAADQQDLSRQVRDLAQQADQLAVLETEYQSFAGGVSERQELIERAYAEGSAVVEVLDAIPYGEFSSMLQYQSVDEIIRSITDRSVVIQKEAPPALLPDFMQDPVDPPGLGPALVPDSTLRYPVPRQEEYLLPEGEPSFMNEEPAGVLRPDGSILHNSPSGFGLEIRQ